MKSLECIQVENGVKEFAEYLVGLGREDDRVFEIYGKTFTNGALKQIELNKDPLAEAFQVNTLTSLVDYIKSNKDKLDLSALTVLIKDEKSVTLMSTMDKHKRREFFINCVAKTPQINFNTYLSSEDFNILMQSCFVDDDDTDRAAILRVIGNISDSAVRQHTDDGTSQKVTIKTGVQIVQDAKVPNPVTLRPYCTFPEIEPPFRKFVLRLQEGPECALFEADGGAWKNTVMFDIKNFLTSYLQREIETYGLSILA